MKHPYWQIAALFVAGGSGTLARWLLSQSLNTRAWPWGTWMVNIAGCFLIGWAAFALGERQWAGWQLRPLVMTGFLGGFTTFSAYGLETLTLLEQGRSATALLYALSSLVLGLAGAAAGAQLARSGGILF
jgi:CrcB protein